MEKEHFIIQMDQSMTEIGMKMFGKVMVHIRIQIMTHMRANGKIIKDRAKEHILMQLQV